MKRFALPLGLFVFLLVLLAPIPATVLVLFVGTVRRLSTVTSPWLCDDGGVLTANTSTVSLPGETQVQVDTLCAYPDGVVEGVDWLFFKLTALCLPLTAAVLASVFVLIYLIGRSESRIPFISGMMLAITVFAGIFVIPLWLLLAPPLGVGMNLDKAWHADTDSIWLLENATRAEDTYAFELYRVDPRTPAVTRADAWDPDEAFRTPLLHTTPEAIWVMDAVEDGSMVRRYTPTGALDQTGEALIAPADKLSEGVTGIERHGGEWFELELYAEDAPRLYWNPATDTVQPERPPLSKTNPSAPESLRDAEAIFVSDAITLYHGDAGTRGRLAPTLLAVDGAGSILWQTNLYAQGPLTDDLLFAYPGGLARPERVVRDAIDGEDAFVFALEPLGPAFFVAISTETGEPLWHWAAHWPR